MENLRVSIVCRLGLYTTSTNVNKRLETARARQASDRDPRQTSGSQVFGLDAPVFHIIRSFVAMTDESKEGLPFLT